MSLYNKAILGEKVAFAEVFDSVRRSGPESVLVYQADEVWESVEFGICRDGSFRAKNFAEHDDSYDPEDLPGPLRFDAGCMVKVKGESVEVGEVTLKFFRTIRPTEPGAVAIDVLKELK